MQPENVKPTTGIKTKKNGKLPEVNSSALEEASADLCDSELQEFDLYKELIKLRSDIDTEKRKSQSLLVQIALEKTKQTHVRMIAEDNEQRYLSLTDSIPHMMWTLNAQGELNYANRYFLEYRGKDSPQTHPTDWLYRIHEQDLHPVQVLWNTCLLEGKQFKKEFRVRRHDGQYGWFLGKIIPITNDAGAIKYWIGTATDIDDHKKIADELESAKTAAEHANATKSAFLANMSHEIRTPLGAILGFSGLLKDTDLSTADRDQYIEKINRNGKALTRIIDDILDLAKVEAGQLDIEEIEFSFFSLVFEVVDLFKEKAKRKEIYLYLKIDESVPNQIISDPTRLRQILINIVGNAVKFTEHGGVTVHVSSELNTDEMLRVNVSVKDTGCGMNREQKERLFKPFTQADNTMTRQYGGTGLGLALSKRLSEALGGGVGIESYAPGLGCTFVFSFTTRSQAPAVIPEESISSIPVASKKKMALKGLRILLVDDSPDNQFLVKRLLTKNGAQVDLANDGYEALEKALDGDFDLVLMDIQMPRMDGFQATQALISIGYDVPIIALTAHAMLDDRAKTQAAGFVAHLTKPVNISEIIMAIEAHAEKR